MKQLDTPATFWLSAVTFNAIQSHRAFHIDYGWQLALQPAIVRFGEFAQVDYRS
jgi:hypothetical protein